MKAMKEKHSNIGLPTGDWLWLEELAIARARAAGGKKPPKKVLVREALALLREAESNR